MNKPVVIINIEGGLVSHVLTSTKEVDVVILDHDTDGLMGVRSDIPGLDGDEVVAQLREPEQVDEKLAREIRESVSHG